MNILLGIIIDIYKVLKWFVFTLVQLTDNYLKFKIVYCYLSDCFYVLIPFYFRQF